MTWNLSACMHSKILRFIFSAIFDNWLLRVSGILLKVTQSKIPISWSLHNYLFQRDICKWDCNKALSCWWYLTMILWISPILLAMFMQRYLFFIHLLAWSRIHLDSKQEGMDLIKNYISLSLITTTSIKSNWDLVLKIANDWICCR